MSKLQCHDDGRRFHLYNSFDLNRNVAFYLAGISEKLYFLKMLENTDFFFTMVIIYGNILKNKIVKFLKVANTAQLSVVVKRIRLGKTYVRTF